MDLTDKLKAGRNALDELVAKIPGFQGYKEREIRRDADRLVRQHVADLVEEQRRRLNDAQVELISAGQVALLDDLERMGTRMHGTVNRLRRASYGYAGLFEAVKVDEEQLEALYRFDVGLLDLVAAIRDAVDDLGQAVEEGGEVAEALKAVQKAVDELAGTVRGREKVILGEELPDLPEGFTETPPDVEKEEQDE